MPKYKVGDIITYNPNTKYKVIKLDVLNNMYDLEVIYSSSYPSTVNSIQPMYIPSVDHYYSLIIDKPKFKLLDVLTLKDDRSYEFYIKNIDSQSQEYLIQYMKVPAKTIHLLNTSLLFSWNIIDNECQMLMTNIQSTNNQCNCDSRILFNRGCGCGAIKTYKQTWK